MGNNCTVDYGKWWVPPPSGRGTLDIVKSCAITIGLLCWSSVCVNVPGPSDTRRHRFAHKLSLFFMGLLAPDILVSLAMGQWDSAVHSVRVCISP
jgi:hypothetical protein